MFGKFFIKKSYVLKTFVVFCGAITIFFLVSTFLEKRKKIIQHEQSPILTVTNNNMIRVEITIKDVITNGKINTVMLDKKPLTLQPSDPEGHRGSFFFQLKPGIYKISWSLKNDKYAWPRLQNYKKEIQISYDKPWVHILIEGDLIIIS